MKNFAKGCFDHYLFLKDLRILILAIPVVVCGCTTTQKDTKSKVLRDPSFPKILSDAFEAHGGLEKWQSSRTLSYDLVLDSGLENQTIDLQSRKVRIINEKFEIGFDGQEVWLIPDSSAFKGNARFYHNLRFYFVALPYLAADPGINYKTLEPATLQGKTYERLLITFNDGVGDSPGDQYILYFNDKKVLELINYSVTYFDRSRAEQFNAIKYEDWISVNGLLLPQTLIGYKWEADTLGEERYRRSFTNFSLSNTVMPDSLYAKPNGAYISPAL